MRSQALFAVTSYRTSGSSFTVKYTGFGSNATSGGVAPEPEAARIRESSSLPAAGRSSDIGSSGIFPM